MNVNKIKSCQFRIDYFKSLIAARVKLSSDANPFLYAKLRKEILELNFLIADLQKQIEKEVSDAN